MDSDSDVVFGTASASSQTNATASTYGIDGGTGADAIENLGSIDATSTSSTTATQSAWGFGGAPSTNAVLESASVSNGIRGGTGNDWIHNGGSGAINATAISTLTSTSGASATFGTAQSSATVGATTTAIGIDSEAGRDTVVNDGEIMVRANGAVSASNDSDAGFFFGEAGAVAAAVAHQDVDALFAAAAPFVRRQRTPPPSEHPHRLDLPPVRRSSTEDGTPVLDGRPPIDRRARSLGRWLT